MINPIATATQYDVFARLISVSSADKKIKQVGVKL